MDSNLLQNILLRTCSRQGFSHQATATITTTIAAAAVAEAEAAIAPQSQIVVGTQ